MTVAWNLLCSRKAATMGAVQGLFVWPNRLIIANGGDNPRVKPHLPRLQPKLKGLLAVTVHRAFLPTLTPQCAPALSQNASSYCHRISAHCLAFLTFCERISGLQTTGTACDCSALFPAPLNKFSEVSW